MRQEDHGPEGFARVGAVELCTCFNTSIETVLVSSVGEALHCFHTEYSDVSCRYINHSCAPNCVAEVVTFERGHKIIISSNRRIQKGEEVRGGRACCSLYQDAAVPGLQLPS